MVAGQGLLADATVAIFGEKNQASSAKAQLERIRDEDFPWIWAIKSVWADDRVPRVSQEMPMLMTYLMQPVSTLTNFRLWITFTNERGVVWYVKPIEPVADSKNTWAEEVRREIPPGCDPVLYVATKIDDAITIYRYPGKPRGMIDLINETARASRSSQQAAQQQ